MTKLTDALELMHSADQRWTSIQAEGIEWTDYVRRHAAFSREMERRSGGRRGSGRGFKPVFGSYRGDQPRPPEQAASHWRTWLRSTTEFRAEIDHAEIETVTQIVRGKSWWTKHGNDPVTSNLGDETHGTGPVAQALNLLRPSILLPHAEFEYVRTATVLGRNGLLLEMRPIPTERVDSLALIGIVGDRSQIVVDAERGVVLRLDSWYDGSPVQRVTFKRILFDEPIDDGMLEPSQPIVDAAKRWQGRRRHYWQLDQVAAAAPHVVFVPTGLEFRTESTPGLWFHGVTADIDDGDLAEGARPSVQLHYSISHSGQAGTLWMQESTSPFVLDTGEEWREFDGVRARHGGTGSQVRLVKEGVYIHLECDVYSLEELADLARSLQRLPAEPPPLVLVR